MNSKPNKPPSVTGYSVAALVALAGSAVALVWGAAAVLPWMNDIEDFSRTEIPGTLTVSVDEPRTNVVYYERHTWFAATPFDPDIDLEVTGPDDTQVAVAPYDVPVTYRMPGRIGEAHATFEAEVAGEYTVAVQGPAHDDATIAVGHSIGASLIRDIAGPAIVLFVSLVTAAAIAIRTARSG